MFKNIAVIGASGAIGKSILKQLSDRQGVERIYAFSSSFEVKKIGNVALYHIDYQNELSLKESASKATKDGSLDLVFVACGVLHNDPVFPEKSLKDLSFYNFEYLTKINVATPALIAKYFLPKLTKTNRSIFAALSARVGSITDNRMGGWYAYRASKAALNMVIKNLAIESARTNKKSIIVGLHPGTVDSNLSKPYQGKVPPNKLFTPEYSGNRLLTVLDRLDPKDSGKCFAWDGKVVEP